MTMVELREMPWLAANRTCVAVHEHVGVLAVLVDKVDARFEVLGDIEGGHVFGRQHQVLDDVMILGVGEP